MCHVLVYSLNSKQRNSLQKIVNFSLKIICDQVRTLSLFCDQQILHEVGSVLKDLEHALCGEFECCLNHGCWFRSMTHKTKEKPLQFDAIVWSVIWTVLTILPGFTRVAVWLTLSGLYGSSNVQVCQVDDSGVCMQAVIICTID